MAWTELDRQMVGYAERRAPVIVNCDGQVRLATLMSWRPRHNGKHTRKARVRFLSGKFAHVKIENVRLP